MSGAAAVGIDVGTTNVKVVLVDEADTLAASAQRPLVTHQDGDIGEQDAEAMWAAVVEAVSEVTSAVPAVAGEVGAIGCCSQYSSIVAVDGSGAPVAPMVMWTDRRGTDHSWELLAAREDAFETWVDRHGIPPVGNGLALAHMLHLQHDRPDVHAATATWLEPMDFVNMRLTGRMAANQGTMFMSQLCDNRTLGVTEYDADLVEMSGLDADRLPALDPLDAPVGTLTGAVAEQLGLPADAVVYGGVNDTVAGAVATGALLDERGGLSIGTTSVLLDAMDAKAVDLDHELLTMPSPFPDTYLLWAENGIGGRALEHVLVDVVHAVDALADHTTDDEFAQLDEALAAVPAGSGGVLFLPWLTGSLSPDADPNVRGGFLNLSLETGRAHMVRAVTEGVAHNLRWLLPYAEGFTGHPMQEIAFLGGAARSTEWCQILADVLDRPIAPLADPDRAVARGVAGLARHRHGVIDRAELDARVELAGRYEPDPANRERYDAMHEQFEAAFVALRPIHEALNG
jgi:xylulokinase